VNDPSSQLHLERYVDRAVGSLRATSRRKSVMREELLAHLLDTFAQELQSAGGADAAMGETIRRFGDCDDLARELAASVPALERMAFLLLNPESRMWRLLCGFGVLVTSFGTTMVLPALAKLKHLGSLTGNGQPLMTLVVGVMIGTVVAVAGVHLLGWGIARRLSQPA